YSPSVELAEKLIGKGYKVVIYDENIRLSKLVGANKAFINERLPHLSELIINDLDKGIEESDVVIISHKDFDPEPYMLLLEEKHTIIDLMRNRKMEVLPNYEGICW
ncbi:MAG TPA: hypothetical protein VNS32_07155, partial [Flavisolibacter sp.]|nr:hypothetical protein [Flavisolibacter sp.]